LAERGRSKGMADRIERELWYAVKPRWWAVWGPVLKRIGVYLGVFGWIVFVLYFVVRGPTSGQIRLDTGDLRYCWWGVPLMYERMSEPERSRLLALAAASPAIQAEWVTCVRYPLHTSNNPEVAYVERYHVIGLWAGEDPKIARWVLEDLSDYTKTGGSRRSFNLLIRLIDWKPERIDPGWREDAEIRSYCAAHGYVPAARK
jgi:hypothetical protein